MEGNRKMDSRKKKKMMEVKKEMNNLTREQLKAAIEKKKVCNAKAQSVVERLIEPNVGEVWLLESLYHINQSHYQDAVEERAIIKSCGYPLCDSLLEEIPKKQYHISTKQNKVFDITDRKNYCSNFCYKASVYLKDQLYTSPLWLRDCEDVVHFRLLSKFNKSGCTGVEVDLGNISPVKTDEDNQKIDDCVERQSTQCVTDSLIESSFSESVEYNERRNDTDKIPCNNIDSQFESKMKKQKVSDKNENSKITCVEENIIEIKTNLEKPIEESEKPKTIKKRTKLKTFNSTSKKEERIVNVADRVDSFLDSWFTVDSLRFLYGDDKVKEIFEEFGTPTERFGQFINTKDAFMYERYAEICKRLNFIELKEKINEREDDVPTKPLPDYDALKEEAQNLEIKVKSFFLGDKVSFKSNPAVDSNDKNDKNESEECKTVPVLPLIDKHCILATRRRIVLEKMYKTLPDIQSALGLSHFNIRHEIQEFVHTLALTPSNIMFSPTEWNLVAMVVIKLFTLRNELLEYAFKTDLTQKRIINLLLSYRLDLDYLQRCVLKLSNVEQIIKNSS
ncbi:hypothetical protein O3M35_002097 [Rhynocoris fuscipes]|uniref:RNA polymerase II subunit B1 CTD phosphatase RPAP2 homolog n=1 Tax=Rhynocoris fuscipes TaxID=488301 RepID=A0AAW1CTV9_9HEMI